MLEHRLGRWIAKEICQEGHCLKRTSHFDLQYKILGKWSRWYGMKLSGMHVDLEDLANRCAFHVKSGKNRREVYIPPHCAKPVDYSKFVYVPPPERPKPFETVVPDPQGSLF